MRRGATWFVSMVISTILGSSAVPSSSSTFQRLSSSTAIFKGVENGGTVYPEDGVTTHLPFS